jgi:hypothetical protein
VGASAPEAGDGVRLVLLLMLSSAVAAAEESSNQPYIDRLRREMPEGPRADEGSYTEKLKSELPPDQRPAPGTYIEQLRRDNPAPPAAGDSFLESEKARLGPPSTKSSIQDVLAGKSDLKPKREGEIHHAAGFRMGAGFAREYVASADFQAQPFSQIYGSASGWNPDLTFFYEYQPFHSEWFGNIGIAGMMGLSYFRGKGQFGLPNIVSPSGGSFGAESRTNFRFVSIPLFLGANYRFNLFRILRPYIQAGPTLNLFFESRDDGQKPIRARSTGGIASGGINLLLDWLFPEAAQNLYAEQGVKHFYLTFDYSRVFTFSGPVRVDGSVYSAGMTYEF